MTRRLFLALLAALGLGRKFKFRIESEQQRLSRLWSELEKQPPLSPMGDWDELIKATVVEDMPPPQEPLYIRVRRAEDGSWEVVDQATREEMERRKHYQPNRVV